ncbi:MAG TPA: hypothetical protein VFT22_21175 [Kofleriaceae bacterium]|nr:hypothetical protein [Kofleriaceae bacterium]
MSPSRFRSLPTAAWLAAGVLGGGLGCGFEASPSNPGGGGDDARIDGPGIDAPPDMAPPAMACYGPPGAWRVCLAVPPTGTVVVPPMLDTDDDPICQPTQPTGWTPAQPEACFIVGDTVKVEMTTAVGARPLVLVAATQVMVNVLDLAGHQGGKPGPGAPSADCRAFVRTPDSGGGAGGGGGGAGGDFTTIAGNGGSGDTGKNKNGQAAQPVGPPTHLRGGCSGQVGGAGDPKDIGPGGGAAYLVSGGAIVATLVNASGGGASGGLKQSGGSGGGSGGMIVLHAATIAAATLIANGGGGASGGSTLAGGAPGQDPPTAIPIRAASGGTTAGAGTGGAGFPAVDNQLDGTGGPDKAGGGGGGGGGGYIRANQALGSAVVFPTLDVVP